MDKDTQRIAAAELTGAAYDGLRAILQAEVTATPQTIPFYLLPLKPHTRPIPSLPTHKSG